MLQYASMDDGDEATRFRVLGPVAVLRAGTALTVGPARQRTLLAALLVDAPRPVDRDVLVDRVWGDDPPPQVLAAVYAYVARLRPVVEQAGAGLLRVSGGYRLDVDPEAVDLHRMRRLASDGDDPATLAEALQLWHGVPLAGLSGEWVEGSRAGWGQERVELAVRWTQALLSGGDAGQAVPLLRDLLGQAPLDEPLVAAAVNALAATGRRPEALMIFDRTRRQLSEELGTDPGPQLRAAHLGALADPPDRPAPDPRTNPAPVEAPAQLPADQPRFAGRVAELAELDAQLGPGDPAPMVIGAISGSAGVGKTTLAVHWAHRVAGRFPDGQLYVNLRGYHPAGVLTDPAEALQGFLGALGVPPAGMPTGLEAMAARFRSLLAGRRMLVVLDNARDADQVRPLLPGTPGCAVLVTSRNRLTSLIAGEGAHDLPLDVLSPLQARELLANRLGPDRVAAEPQAVRDIVRACARLPLALAVAAAQAGQRPAPLSELAEQLTDAERRFEVLDAGDDAGRVESVFSWSYAAIGPQAARLFRLTGLHTGPDFSAAAAASLAGLPPATTRRLLAELCRANLLTEPEPGRYSGHDLLRAYALRRCEAEESAEARDSAHRRLLDHYVHSGVYAAWTIAPAGRPAPPDIGPLARACRPERPADRKAALTWFAGEQPVLVATARALVGTPLQRYTCTITRVTGVYLRAVGRHLDLAALAEAALAAARQLGDDVLLGRAHRECGHLASFRGEYGPSRAHFLDAEAAFERAADLETASAVQAELASLAVKHQRPAESLAHAEKAYELRVRAGDLPVPFGGVYYHLAVAHGLLGNHTEAVRYGELTLASNRECGDRMGTAYGHEALGLAYFGAGRTAEAARQLAASLELFRELGVRDQVAKVLSESGDARLVLGDPGGAARAWEESLAVFTELELPQAADVRAKLHGHTGRAAEAS